MSLAQATASINEFAQTRLLELEQNQKPPNLQNEGEVDVVKNDEEYSQQAEKENLTPTPKTKQKNKWWPW